MRERVMNYGVDSLQDHELLELLLFYVIPRRDTNALAHSLIKSFGSLHAVLEAPIDELRAAGLSEKAAFWINHIKDFAECYRAYFTFLSESREPSDDYLRRYSEKARHKLAQGDVMVLSFNPQGQLCCESIIKNKKKRSDESLLREICTAATKNHAHYVVLIKAASSEEILPGEYECLLNCEISNALKSLDIIMLDCIAVSENSSRSYKNIGALFTSPLEFVRSEYYRSYCRKS